MSGRVREVRGTIVLSHARACRADEERRERGEDEVTPRLGWFRFGLETCLRGEERNSFVAVVGGNGTRGIRRDRSLRRSPRDDTTAPTRCNIAAVALVQV